MSFHEASCCESLHPFLRLLSQRDRPLVICRVCKKSTVFCCSCASLCVNSRRCAAVLTAALALGALLAAYHAGRHSESNRPQVTDFPTYKLVRVDPSVI